MLSSNPTENYFKGIDEVEAAFDRVSVFAENKLAMMDAAIKWLTEFRDEYKKRLYADKNLRRVK
jgi:hypothetical protein